MQSQKNPQEQKQKPTNCLFTNEKIMHPRSRAVLNFVTEEAAPSAERGCREESGHGYRPSAEGSASWPV